MFEAETGIKVEYEEYITPENMYTKYKAGAIDYDLICTSDYMIEKLIGEDEVLEMWIILTLIFRNPSTRKTNTRSPISLERWAFSITGKW